MRAAHPNYIVDQDSNRTAVVLSIKEWATILEELEELADIRAYDEAKKGSQEAMPFEEAVADIQSAS